MILASTFPGPVATQEVTWTVVETPALSFGEDSDLDDVRGLVRLSDGRFIVADRKQRLLVFDGEGDYLRTFGTRGSGVGEFRAIYRIQLLPNDTVLVSDLNNGSRISFLTADNGFVRSINSNFYQPPKFEGALADGTLLATVFYSSASTGSNPFKPNAGVWWGRGEIELLRFDGEGRRVLNSLGVFPDTQELFLPGLGTTRMDGWGSPLHQTLVAVAGGRVYVATGDRHEVLMFRPDGRNPDVIRGTPYEARHLTQEDLIQFYASSWIGDRLDWSALRWNVPDDLRVPQVTFLLLDDEGNLWTEEGGKIADGLQTWSVFGPSGEYRAKVMMPSRFQPFSIGSEAVLGVWQDDFDVEHVQLRTIVKPQGDE